jgi:hypothetical protein
MKFNIGFQISPLRTRSGSKGEYLLHAQIELKKKARFQVIVAIMKAHRFTFNSHLSSNQLYAHELCVSHVRIKGVSQGELYLAIEFKLNIIIEFNYHKELIPNMLLVCFVYPSF